MGPYEQANYLMQLLLPLAWASEKSDQRRLCYLLSVHIVAKLILSKFQLSNLPPKLRRLI